MNEICQTEEYPDNFKGKNTVIQELVHVVQMASSRTSVLELVQEPLSS